MGTRATVQFKKGEDVILNVFHMFDGCESYVGVKLAEFLQSIKMVSGISGFPFLFDVANGMGDLALQYILKFKDKVGGIYAEPVDRAEYYNYIVEYLDEGLIIIFNDKKYTPKEFIDTFRE